MKKSILITSLLLPLGAYAQTYSGGGFGSVMAFVITVGICILIFLALRQIMLWYWKVDTIIKNQERLNELLEEQIKIQQKHYAYMENNIYSIKDKLQTK